MSFFPGKCQGGRHHRQDNAAADHKTVTALRQSRRLSWPRPKSLVTAAVWAALGRLSTDAPVARRRGQRTRARRWSWKKACPGLARDGPAVPRSAGRRTREQGLHCGCSGHHGCCAARHTKVEMRLHTCMTVSTYINEPPPPRTTKLKLAGKRVKYESVIIWPKPSHFT